MYNQHHSEEKFIPCYQNLQCCSNILYHYTVDNGDYIAVSTPLTFTPGSGSQQQCTDITIINDEVVESDETFVVTLDTSDVSDREHVDFSPVSAATVVITNDDSKFY